MSTIDIGIGLPVKQTQPTPAAMQRTPTPAPHVPAPRIAPGLDDFYVGSTKIESSAAAEA